MELTVRERLHTLSLLPLKGTLAQMKIKNQIRKKLDFNADEIETLELVLEGTKATWKIDKEFMTSVDFTEDQINLLLAGVDELDKEGSVGDDLYNLSVKIQDELTPPELKELKEEGSN